MRAEARIVSENRRSKVLLRLKDRSLQRATIVFSLKFNLRQNFEGIGWVR